MNSAKSLRTIWNAGRMRPHGRSSGCDMTVSRNEGNLRTAAVAARTRNGIRPVSTCTWDCDRRCTSVPTGETGKRCAALSELGAQWDRGCLKMITGACRTLLSLEW